MILVALFSILITVGLCERLPFFLTNSCLTSECYHSGFQIAESLNKSADPCSNFYNFSCGGWISKTKVPEWEPSWNHWQSATAKAQNRLELILNKGYSQNTTSLKKAQYLYWKCTTKKVPATLLIKVLSYLNGWPLGYHDWKEEFGKWTDLMTTAINQYDVHPLFKIHVQVNLYNTSRHTVYIESGNIILPEAILLHPLNHMAQISAYKKWIIVSSNYIAGDSKITSIWKEEQVIEMIEFEMQLATLRILEDRHEDVSLRELSKQTKFAWVEIFEKVFGAGAAFGPETHVIIKGRNYIEQVLSLVKKTNPRVVANFIIWSIIKELSKFGDENFQNWSFEMEKSLLGITAPLPRSRECVDFVAKHAGYAIMPHYIRNFVQNDAVDEVKKMVENIKFQFIKTLRKSSWLDKETRELAVQKIVAIKLLIGYPEWILNEDEIIERVQFPDTDKDYFEAPFFYRKKAMWNQYLKLQRLVADPWPENPFEVNAYYSVLQNAIIIPVGLLVPPFFDMRRPAVYNYGSLGTLIGHEMSHALDNIGRKIDMNKKFRKWWPDADVLKFKKRTKCFEKQYSDMGVDGMQTLGENIADNVGLQLSFDTLLNLREKNAFVATPTQKFSRNQLFFMSFAQLWCEIAPPAYLLHGEEHAPDHARVFAPLKNMQAFQKAFHCPENKNKCYLW